MAGEGSYQRHVGPWPIKRSQSVPDTSVSIFTPRNSPPNLATLLADVEEDDREHEAAPFSYGATDMADIWTGYSMTQNRNDLKKELIVDTKITARKRRDQPGPERWILQGVVVLGSCTTIFVPYCIAAYLGQLEPGHATLPKKSPPTSPIYLLLYLSTTASAVVTAVAVRSLDMIVYRKAVNRERLTGMIRDMLIAWVLTTLAWLFIMFLL